MNQYDKTNVSMPVYEFQEKYSEYCSKNGYVEMQDLDSPEFKSVLKSFKLRIESYEGKTKPSYTNIRFKTLKERA